MLAEITSVFAVLQEAVEELFHPLVLVQSLLPQDVVDVALGLALQPLVDITQHLQHNYASIDLMSPAPSTAHPGCTVSRSLASRAIPRPFATQLITRE